jgi:uncharacterized protein (TIGR02300 family)
MTKLTGAPEASPAAANVQSGFIKDFRTVAKPELGAKRQCQSCGTKFYDLNKDPILCPKCGAVFQVAALARAARHVAQEEEEEVEKDAPEIVSLDEVEESENKVDAIVVDDDIEVEDDPEVDDTFLEEEEESDDDVAGLIDGDIETDDEP